MHVSYSMLLYNPTSIMETSVDISKRLILYIWRLLGRGIKVWITFFLVHMHFVGGFGGCKLDEKPMFEVLIFDSVTQKFNWFSCFLFVQSYTWASGRRCTTTQSTLKEVITSIHSCLLFHIICLSIDTDRKKMKILKRRRGTCAFP